MPHRPSNSIDPVRVGPLNIDGWTQYEVDVSNVGTVLEYGVDTTDLDPALAVGDGVTTVTTELGDETPPAPTLSSDKITFALFQASGQTLRNRRDYRATVYYRTASGVDSVTLVFPAVRDR